MSAHILLIAKITLFLRVPGLGSHVTNHRQQSQSAPDVTYLLGKHQYRVILIGHVTYADIKLHVE